MAGSQLGAALRRESYLNIRRIGTVQPIIESP
jgi:hypothetical protein